MNIGSSPYRLSKAPRQAPRPELKLEYPSEEVEPARNGRPVVLLHGTIVEKDGIEEFRKFALSQGHPVNHRSYPTITKGGLIEESTEIASREVNKSRAEVARGRIEALKERTPQALTEFFQIDAELYGERDPDAEKILPHLPGLVAQVESVVTGPQAQIESRLGRSLKAIEADLVEGLKKDGLTEQKAAAIAEELLDTVAPKAIVIGHSAGGFVAQTLAVNPETQDGDDPFAYDGGNGVGEVVLLSSPVGKGLPQPAPTGILELPFYNYDRTVLQPAEKNPLVTLARLNPLTNLAYTSSKSLLKTLFYVGTQVSTTMTSPMVHLAKPGYAQVEESHEFFNQYVKDREIPEGLTVISVTSPLDKLVQEERSRLSDEMENGHNYSFDLDVTEEQVKKERPTWTHVIMTEQPEHLKKEYSEDILAQPKALMKLLNPKNDEGVRVKALDILWAGLETSPDYLKAHPEVKDVLEKVAAERLPFEDSASYKAYSLLAMSSNL
ncbi:MAG TPA: hypothetical protein EYO33_18880 [Phycisphaerales bacterium]|nr:hypothetical protein [Phycisphaerales bacterium]